jgi:hypothetical protein
MKALVIMAVMGLSAAAWASPYTDAVLADNPICYWRLNDTGSGNGTTAVDQMGNHHGIYSNGVTLGVAGAIADGDPAASFNRSLLQSVQIQDPSTYGLVAQSNSFNTTIEAWFKLSSTGNLMCVYSENYYGSPVYYSGVDANNHVFLGVHNSGWYNATDTATVREGQWYHFATVMDQTAGMKVYLDGQLVASNPNTGISPRGLVMTEFLGVYPLNYHNNWVAHFDGVIDEVAIYHTALSQDRLLAHMNAALIPEPGALMLLGLGIFVLARRGRRGQR